MKGLVLKARGVAHVLDCSPDDAVLLARKGKLKGEKRGRFWFFELKEVLAYKKSIQQD